MQIRRHKDIIAIKEGTANPVGFHAKNLEVAELSEAIWDSMAPTTFANGFVTFFEPNEVKNLELLNSLEEWNSENNSEAHTVSLGNTFRSLMINVTQICNLHCTYCAAGGDGTYGDPVAKISLEKTLPQVTYLINKLQPGAFFEITFLGGEPLLYPEAMKSIADHAKEVAAARGVEIGFNVITNATLINEKSLPALESMKANITISIDGAPEVQDRLRPQKNGKGSSEMAINGLKEALKRREFLGKILFHSVFTKTHTSVVDSYNYLSQFNPDSYDFNYDVQEADRDSNLEFVIQMSKVAELAFSKGGETELRKIAVFNKYFDALDEQARTENHCGSGKSLLSMDSKGQMYACPLDVGHADELLGEASDLNKEKLSALQEPFIEKNNCQTCWARFLCGGGCLYVHKSLTGSKHKKHTSFCERTRSLISLSIIYYERSRH
jgi:uncharacterized protein